MDTLSKNWQFARAYRSKKRFASPLVATYIVPHRGGGIRIGITASKKLGCAVERNRARRIVKAAASSLLSDADGCFDIVFVCRGAIAGKKSTDLEPVLRSHLKSAGVLR